MGTRVSMSINAASKNVVNTDMERTSVGKEKTQPKVRIPNRRNNRPGGNC